METSVSRAVRLLPQDDAELAKRLKLPLEEIATLRSEPDLAPLGTRSLIAAALVAGADATGDRKAAMKLADELWRDTQAALLGQVSAEPSPDVGPASAREHSRSLMEMLVREYGPEIIE